MTPARGEICPISYNPLSSGELYSTEGLKSLSKQLKSLRVLEMTSEELRIEAARRADKISIQGVQPKLSAKLRISRGCFEIVNRGGQYILKPQNDLYPELPENEDLSMRLAGAAGIETPLHGLLYSKDGRFTYFIRRFDRLLSNKKVPLEDFAQLAGKTRDTKYNFSMEGIVKIIDKFCSFPIIEKKKLLLRTLFNFITGNEDMHLKNFSLITRDNVVELSPVYDLVNTTIAVESPKEELALPLNGRKTKLHRKDFMEYFACEKMGLNRNTAEDVLAQIKQSYDTWRKLIGISFLSDGMKNKYSRIIEERLSRL
ncbi:MAG: HipA domain-containing protein [Candidatus Omnitrophota bacterium]